MRSSLASEEISRELDAWASAGIAARFWWRDDDAASSTPELRRIIDFWQRFEVSAALAVIPEKVDNSLVDLVAESDCCIWQHGWRHQFHLDGEFGDRRALPAMIEEALEGRCALDRRFGTGRWQEVFVPPNHRLSARFKTLLPALGYRGLSAGIPLTPPLRHVVEVNAEIDIMDWPNGRMLESDTIARMIVDALQARRRGALSIDTPIGILSHHLRLDSSAWESLTPLMEDLVSHSGARLVPAGSLFPRNASWSPSESSKPTETAGVTVVITSCGRQDLLEKTIESFLEFNTYPIRRLVVVEDGGRAANASLAERFRKAAIEWLGTGSRLGQVAAIDFAYASVDSEYIFHCEDDWQFVAPGFVEKSLAILRENAQILQVSLRALDDTNKHPILSATLLTGGVPYRLLQPDFHSRDWGTWHGFSWNPGLRRLREYQLIGSFGAFDGSRGRKPYEIEREASNFYLDNGFLVAILADNDGSGYVRHLGWGRHIGPSEPLERPDDTVPARSTPGGG